MGSTCVSAGGKVLLAGGYLVLDPKYSGVVVSTSSRFFSVISDGNSSTRRSTISVQSPQFRDALWVYKIAVDPVVEVSSFDMSSENKFVRIALQCVLALACEIRGAQVLNQHLAKGLIISIVGDNDFYSQRTLLETLRLPPTIESLSSLPRFSSSAGTLSEAHKTGLGSSAALVSSLVTALLVHLDIIAKDSASSNGGLQRDSLTLAHNTAQYAHCLAQGKIGSGFDVSAAIYGSHLYTRFNPSVIELLMSPQADAARSLKNVLSPENKAWNHRVVPFSLPPYLRLILADVNAGSDTPALVAKVLKWRSSSPEQAREVWESIAFANNQFAAKLEQLTAAEQSDRLSYRTAFERLSRTPISSIPLLRDRDPAAVPGVTLIETQLESLRLTAEEIRAGMRKMGELAGGIPIEPNEQTKLVDACLALPGVICGGVPGAGGYDAIWLLIIDTDGVGSIVADVAQLWQEWKEMDVSPLLATESTTAGVRLEDVDSVPGLRVAQDRLTTSG